ncbi:MULTISPECIES: hypothetical protein [unclassified Streptomyces]|uniref:hypothetical protein n=1 Tax=unclassified Streptomyces TaxID=2593676 RepID=UPI002E15B8B3|nr:hypothetical protein OG457_40590 [Streptomyces sp. NBC_01207]WTA22680.1 hypothetical protein OG365_34240 [Streptomyces sp. NBC_00853]
MRPLLRRLAEKAHSSKDKACAVYDAIVAWSDTPGGRLTRWVIGTLVALAAIAAR